MESRTLKTYKNKISQAFKIGYHLGIDIIGHNGLNNGSGYLDYIIAHSDGVVVGVRNNYATNDRTGNSYGNYVKIKHDNGYYTLYAHLKYNSVTVKVGDRVKKGQVIGSMGNTGHSFGAHLHFEVRNENDIKIDPTPFINSDLPAKVSIENVAKQIFEILKISGYKLSDVQNKIVELESQLVTSIKKLYLPSSEETWRVYPLDKKPIVGNECGFLRPSRFGGLEYEILGYSQADVALIQTQDFGKVQIYVAKSTGAIIK